jgi:hypothetical protein
MTKRFFKLIYTISIIILVLSMPVYLLININFDNIIVSTYKARCNSNDKYVVLEGASFGESYEFDEFVLNDTIYSDTKKQLNFYCKYYDQVQPYVISYANSKTIQDEINANIEFFNFKDSVYDNVYSYPPLYSLEETRKDYRWNELYGPMVVWFFGALGIFAVLQVFRMCYVYVVFGEIVWHPFRQTRK